MRTTLVAAAIALALGLHPSAATAASSTHRHHAVRKTAPAPNVQEELAARDREIAALKTAVAQLQTQVAGLQQQQTAQADATTQTRQDVQALQASTTTTTTKTDKLEKVVDDTTVSGRMFVDLSDLAQTHNGVRTPADGYGLDIKRGYLTVNHRFDDIWSATLTTDFNYVAANGQTQLFMKNLYLQGKFSNAFVFRAGEIPMAWTPYVENFYGYRYVENTLTDRAKVANTADWGLGASGQFGDGRFDYAGVVVNGAGFRNPTRSSRMDFEGRLAYSPIDGLGIAVGGYSGTLGKDTATTNAIHTATRGDVMVAWARGNNRIGAEYFSASNWNTVLSPLRDKASGYSLWGSFGFNTAWSVFARFDRVDPSKYLNPSLRDRYYNLGLQWDVRKGIKLALVYKNDDLRDLVNRMQTQEFGLFGDIAF
ncbi:MAG: carbohydrate porin [Proteobacteria bacterium]|nr:carbohydrate porin [Pseudomonadota bacterium]